MDGLLIDSEPFWQKSEQLIFGELGINISDKMLEKTMGLRSDTQIEYWYNYQPWEGVSFEEVEKRYDKLIINFFKTEATLMEGAKETLEFFKAKNLPLALASSSNMKLINSFLDRFELRSYFKVVHSAEFESHGKPHPAVFIKTAKSMNVNPTDCLVLEDSFVGMIAAKAARMKVIAVPTEKEPRFEAADIILDSLIQVNDEIFNELNRF